MMMQIPLFPLGTILFPGAQLSLHIFEERYREMIGKCLEQNTPFGVVLIREGDEVVEGRLGARQAEPYNVGTLAHISEYLRLEDGRYLLSATGGARFRLQYVVQRAPYLVASVVELPAESVPGVTQAADELRLLYNRYWQALASATGVPVEPEELPADPAAMAYQLADRLQMTPARKQHWLESNINTCIAEIGSALRTELALLPRSGTGPVNSDWSGMGSLN